MSPDRCPPLPSRTAIVIPARYASTRFPAKPLALIDGIPMIIRVLRNAQQAHCADTVMVATDHDDIRQIVESAGGLCVMTSPDLASGTDRIAVATRDLDIDYVINLQGDEPMIDADYISIALQSLHADPESVVSTLATPIRYRSELCDPNVVKVLINRFDRATYFSRAPIPYPASMDSVNDCSSYYRHIGLYVYRKKYIEKFVKTPPSWSERVERLEQLRILDHGELIHVTVVKKHFPGVDTPEDIAVIEKMLRENQSE